MFDKKKFYKEIRHIAIPITLQSFFESSVSVIDQIMVGQLGSISIAGAGIGGKFSSLLCVTVSGIAAASGIIAGKALGNSRYDDAYIMSNLYIVCIFSYVICESIKYDIRGRNLKKRRKYKNSNAYRHYWNMDIWNS
ncbi:MAG TPA: hypothetical protein DG753_00545 [Clostridium sp.]|nr:hypothetical protein [Clostridium sp.]